MNIRKRLRREHRHEIRQLRRRYYELYLLQWMLLWVEIRSHGIAREDLGSTIAFVLQQALLDLHGERMAVMPFDLVRYTTKDGTSTEQRAAIAKKEKRRGRRKRHRFWRFEPASPKVLERLHRRLRYRGGRKARAARRRIDACGNGWRSATTLGLTMGLGAMIYGATGLFGRRFATVGKVA